MSKLNGVMKLTESQFRELSNNGTITVGGTTYTYDPNGTLYITDDTSGGGSGGGSQLYMHYIEINTTDLNAPMGILSFDIINSSSSQITFIELFNWLTANNFTEVNPYRNVFGFSRDSSSNVAYNGGCIGVDMYGAEEIRIRYKAEGSGGTTLTNITITSNSSNYTISNKIITL